MSAMKTSDIVRLLEDTGSSYRLVGKGNHTIQRVSNLGTHPQFYSYKIVNTIMQRERYIYVAQKGGKISKEDVCNAMQGIKEALLEIGIIDDLEDKKNEIE